MRGEIFLELPGIVGPIGHVAIPGDRMHTVHHTAVGQEIEDEVPQLFDGLNAVIGALCSTVIAIGSSLGLEVPAALTDRVRDDLEEVIRALGTLFVDFDGTEDSRDGMRMEGPIQMIFAGDGVLSLEVDDVQTAHQVSSEIACPRSRPNILDVAFPIIDGGGYGVHESDTDIDARLPAVIVFHVHSGPESLSIDSSLFPRPEMPTLRALSLMAAVAGPIGMTAALAMTGEGRTTFRTTIAVSGEVGPVHFSAC